MDASKKREAAFVEVADWIGRRAGEKSPFLLGIGGPGGCGKSTLSQWLAQQLSGAVVLPLDDFRLPRQQRRPGLFGSHPEGNDLERLRICLRAARRGEAFERPAFDPAIGNRTVPVRVPPCRILLCDGEIAAHSDVRNELDALVLVDAHWRTQLNTRLTRDLRERQCGLAKAVEIFLQSNLRDYPTYAGDAAERAEFILYRNTRDRFTLKKRPV